MKHQQHDYTSLNIESYATDNVAGIHGRHIFNGDLEWVLQLFGVEILYQ